MEKIKLELTIEEFENIQISLSEFIKIIKKDDFYKNEITKYSEEINKILTNITNQYIKQTERS